MDIVNILISNIKSILESLYSTEINKSQISLQKTRIEFEGDFTLVVFPFLRISKKSPDETAAEIGNQLISESFIDNYNVIKGFVNVSLNDEFWINYLIKALDNKLISK